MNELEDFLNETAKILGTSGSISTFGVSRILSVSCNKRVVEIGTNGPMFWLQADFDWQDFPTDGTFISWAPDQSMLRTKLLEGPGSPVTTGNDRFDATYLIYGASSGKLLEIHPQAIQLLLASEHLRPHLTGRGISYETLRWRKWKHIRCEPSLFTGPDRVGAVTLGAERYTPAFAALWAEELSTLVTELAGVVNED